MPRCFYQYDTGRSIGPCREYLHHSHSGRSSGHGGGQAPDSSWGGHAFLIFIWSRNAGNRSWYIYRITYISATVRDMDAQDPEDLRGPYDPGGGIFPHQDWRIFDMSCLETGKKFAVLFLSSILLITVLICLSASAEENNAATELTAPDFELQNLQGSNVSLSQFKGQKPVLL